MSTKTERIRHYLSIIMDVDGELKKQSKILDLGCGNGDVIMAYNNDGYDAYGCDVAFKDGDNVEELENSGRIRSIQLKPYKLPFEDNYFDLVVSDQVFEHIKDYASALAEMKRVMKSGGISLHVFPSKYRIIEPHVRVPLATLIQSYWWLRIWAGLGIKKEKQGGMLAREIARFNYEYLKSSTNYLSKSEIQKEIKHYFNNVKFCERAFLKHSKKGRYVYVMSNVFPFLSRFYSFLGSRVVFYRK